MGIILKAKKTYVRIYVYGHRAPSKKRYEGVYYPFYKIARDLNPTLPIAMISLLPVCIDIKNEYRAKND